MFVFLLFTEFSEDTFWVEEFVKVVSARVVFSLPPEAGSHYVVLGGGGEGAGTHPSSWLAYGNDNPQHILPVLEL